MCDKIGTEDKPGKIERTLMKAAENVMNKYKGNSLHMLGGGKPNKMYYVYRKLSTEIHESPHYGFEVGRMIVCNSLGVRCYFRWPYHSPSLKTGKNFSLYWPRRALAQALL